MKKCSKCGTLKPLSEFYAGKGYKGGYRKQCKVCCLKQNAKTAALPDSRSARKVSYAAYVKRNKDRIVNRMKGYRQDNKEHFSDYGKQYNIDNPGAATARQAKRRASKLKATPAWANTQEIKKLYIEARQSGMHVDHIYPLQSDWVCGLHVLDNLHILSPAENLSKSNKRDASCRV